MKIDRFWFPFASRNRNPGRSRKGNSRQTRRLNLEQLETRQLLTGDLELTNAELVSLDGQRLAHVAAGEQFSLRAEWKANELAATDRYGVRFSVDGDVLDSLTIGSGTGGGGGATSDGDVNQGGLNSEGHFWQRGSWFASPGSHTVTVTVDGSQGVQETNESNNSISFTFFGADSTSLPAKLVWPVGGAPNQDWVCCNYVDVVRGTNSTADFRGGGFTIGQHGGLDIGLANFAKMDRGVPVFAVATGQVFGVKDGNFDRVAANAAGPDGDGNGLWIDHGNQWTSAYGHLARNTITVQDGDWVTPGELIGYVGSSGGSSNPHLHFELRHGGSIVETFFAPEQYWQNPPQYLGDVEQSFLYFGVTNLGGDLLERPSTIDTFPFSSPLQSPIVFWNAFSNRHAGDIVTNKWLRPDGSIVSVIESTTSSDGSAGIGSAVLARGNFNAVGTWNWVREVNGVEKLRVPFTITADQPVPSIRLQHDGVTILNGRTTPIDFGTAIRGGTPTQRTFSVQNHGFADLALSSLEIPAGYSVVDEFPLTVPADSSVDFKLQLDTNTSGWQLGEVRFKTNDPDVREFRFAVEGNVAGVSDIDIPGLTLPGPSAVAFPFSGLPVILSPEAIVESIANFDRGALRIDVVGGAEETDRLLIAPAESVAISGQNIAYEGTLIGTLSGGLESDPLEISFNESITQNAVQAILRRVAYQNVDSHPATHPRYLQLTLIDNHDVPSPPAYKTVVLADFEENVSPILNQSLTPFSETEDFEFEIALPGDLFVDANSYDGQLVFAVQHADGQPLPSWMEFNAETRILRGIPGNEHVGSIQLQVLGRDAAQATVATELQIDVVNTNDGPAVNLPLIDQQATEDSEFQFVVPAGTFRDVDPGDVLNLDATLVGGHPLPEWLSFDPVSHLFQGIPENTDVGSLAIRVSASDDESTVASNFTLTVNNTNDAPERIGELSDLVAVEDEQFSFQFPATLFRDVDSGDSLRYSVDLADGSPLPTWLTFVHGEQWLHGVPTNEDVRSLSVRVTAVDLAGTSAAAVFALGVVNSNDAPINLTLDTFHIVENTAGGSIGNVAVEDPDARDTHVISVLDPRFEVSDGKLGLRANESLDCESQSSIQLTIVATDSGEPPLSIARTFTIIVDDVNEHAPSIQIDQQWQIVERAERDLFVGQIIASDQDTTDELRFAIVSGNEDGAFALDPSNGEVRVADGQMLDYETATQRLLMVEVSDSVEPVRVSLEALTIRVIDQDEAPRIVARPESVYLRSNVVTQFSFPADTFHDEDAGDVPSYSAVMDSGAALPSWLSFDSETLTFQAAAESSDAGQITLQLLARDPDLPSQVVSQTMAVIVEANPFPWHATIEPFDVNGDGFISPLDVLVVINEVNLARVRHPTTGKLPTFFDPQEFAYDVSADGFVTPIDALTIINFLNEEGRKSTRS